MSSSTNPLAIEKPPTVLLQLAGKNQRVCISDRISSSNLTHVCVSGPRSWLWIMPYYLVPPVYCQHKWRCLKTVIHAFYFARALSMHTVDSERKFRSIHAYILIACSFLEAGKSNIYHFVSHLCLKSICSTCGDARGAAACSHSVSASLARVHLPAFNILMESDSISNSLTIPFRFAHMKKKKTSNTWLLSPNIHIYFGWFHALQQHNPARVLVHPNNSKCLVGLLLSSIWHRAGPEWRKVRASGLCQHLLPSFSNNHQTPYRAALLMLGASFLLAWLPFPLRSSRIQFNKCQ